MAASVKNKLQALDILKEYNGTNPYILMLKRNVFFNKNELSDFNIEYIIKNHNFQPLEINKMVKLADWYQKKKKEDWGIDFSPEKVSVKWLLGETSTTYHCYVKYRQSVEPVQAFLPKKGILTNFLVSDYKKLNIDFDRYDKLSMMKDVNRKLREHQKTGVQFLLSRKKCRKRGFTNAVKSVILLNSDCSLIRCETSARTHSKRPRKVLPHLCAGPIFYF